MRGEGAKVSERGTWARERGIIAGAWRGKSGVRSEERQVPRRRKRTSKESLSRRSRRNHERISGCKAIQDDLQSLGFWPNLKSERRLEDEEPTYKMAEQNESG